MGTVDLYTIEASLVAQVGSLSPVFHILLYFWDGQGSRLVEPVSSPLDCQLYV